MSIEPENLPESPKPVQAAGKSDKKLVSGILAILLGTFGVHKFYLGYTKEGIIQLILGLACGIGSIIGLIEGIIYLTRTDQEFEQMYVVGRKPWF